MATKYYPFGNLIDWEMEKLQSDWSHVLTRVSESARPAILANATLRELFTQPCDAFVMSVDVRRSTELMLRAKCPENFAEFSLRLFQGLRQAIWDRHGVVDKFTGDGILAFFPLFFTGNDAGLLAVDAADECHRVFRDLFQSRRDYFDRIMQDTGLGIGIDFGQVSLVQMGGELTVIGEPVVYSCRLGSCDAGDTLVNEPAFEELQKVSEFLKIRETSIRVKHQGEILAYFVRRNEKPLPDVRAYWELELWDENSAITPASETTENSCEDAADSSDQNAQL